jgi:hypothetical protein
LLLGKRALSGNTELNQIYQFTFGSSLPQESGGQVVVEAERFTYQIGHSNRTWLTQTVLADYNDTGYLSALPDTGQIFTTVYTTTSPELLYTINFTTTGTYYVWLRGYAPNAAGDSVYVTLEDQPAAVLTGLPPRQWAWANDSSQDHRLTFEVTEPGNIPCSYGIGKMA